MPGVRSQKRHRGPVCPRSSPGSGLASCLPLVALVVGGDEPDRPLGRIGRRHQIAQLIEDPLQLIARIAAEGVVLHRQSFGEAEGQVLQTGPDPSKTSIASWSSGCRTLRHQEARASRLERFDPQALDGREVFDVGGEQRCLNLDGGGADQRIGQPHAMGQRQRINQR